MYDLALCSVWLDFHNARLEAWESAYRAGYAPHARTVGDKCTLTRAQSGNLALDGRWLCGLSGGALTLARSCGGLLDLCHGAEGSAIAPALRAMWRVYEALQVEATIARIHTYTMEASEVHGRLRWVALRSLERFYPEPGQRCAFLQLWRGYLRSCLHWGLAGCLRRYDPPTSYDETKSPVSSPGVFACVAALQALEQLPAKQRRAVIAIALESLELEDVAKSQGVRVDSVRRALDRGLDTLRVALRTE